MPPLEASRALTPLSKALPRPTGASLSADLDRKREGWRCCEPPPKGAFWQSRPSLVTPAEQDTHLWPLPGQHSPGEPYLGTPGCKQSRASHEAAARAGQGGEAAQLLGLSIASGSLPAALPDSLHTPSAQVSPALALNLSSCRMGRQERHSAVRSPLISIRGAALINLPWI